MSVGPNLSDDVIYRGQRKSFTLTMDPVVNITGWTIVMRFATRRRNKQAFLQLSMTVTDGPNGVATATLTAAQTMAMNEGPIYCDVWRTDTSNETPLAQMTLPVGPVIEAA